MGHFFNVMTNGWGAMADYSAQVPVADRWRIAAYIRALQLSQTATARDVPAGTAGDAAMHRSTRAANRYASCSGTRKPEPTEAK